MKAAHTWMAVFHPLIRALGLTLLLLVPAVLSAAGKTEELTLSVGEESTFQGVQMFAVDNPQILGSAAATTKDGKVLVVHGQKVGSTKLFLRDRDTTRTIDVTVVARDPKLVLQEINGLLRNYTDIALRLSGSQVVMEGSVVNEAQLVQLKEIEKRYEGQVSNLVTVGLSGLRRNMMIRLDIHYVQVLRRLSRKFGIRYPANVAAGGLVNFFIGSSTMGIMNPVSQYSLIDTLLPSLDLNESNGFIRVMRTDTLVSENGARAVYRDGSEIQVRLNGTIGGGTLEKVFYGAELTVTPKLAASNDAVSIEISANLSQRDTTTTLDGIPGRILDAIQTQVYVPIGQSMMLSGVDLKSTGRLTTGIPWLNRIPILGYLFGSEEKDAESAYGVVYITPTLVQQSTQQMQQQIDNALKYFEKPGSLKRY